MPSSDAPPIDRPNVLFIIADDWSPLAGCYGSDFIATPHIDRFAERGTVFDHAFCASPSCAVSRASILTGQHSHTHGQYGHCHGIHGFRTHQSMPSTPKLLRDAGYATGLIGKKHCEPWSVYPFEVELHPHQMDTRSPAAFERKVGAFLEYAADRPFYCHVGISDPHRGGDDSQYDNDWAHEGDEPVHYNAEHVPVPGFLPDTPETRRDLAEYYRAVSRFDQCVGATLRALERSGRAEQTLVIVTSDHGMPFPGAKASSFEGGHHCPLIVASPSQQQRGIHNRALVNWLDFMPTVLAWCGVSAPDNLPGRSLLPILAQTDPDGWDEVVYSHCFHEVTNYYPYRVLRGRRYKYVRNLAWQLRTPLPTDLFRSRTWQSVLSRDVEMLGERPREHFLQQPREALYDLQDDPHETTTLIDKPELAETVEAMRQRLTDFRVQTADPWLEVCFQEGEVAAHNV
ncbi:MAG: sulfatase [Phycisphaeraceae bacterium]